MSLDSSHTDNTIYKRRKTGDDSEFKVRSNIQSCSGTEPKVSYLC